MSTVEYQRADPARLRANVPADLKALPIWLLWKSETATEATKKDKKIPYYADGKKRSGALDSPSDRSRLVSFDDIMRLYESDRDHYMGPGVALGKVPHTAIQISGIDPDDSIHGGIIKPNVQRIVDAAGSYTEISPSNTGCKIFGTGDIGKETKPPLEIYSEARYFTVTGQLISGDRLADLREAAKVARAWLLKKATTRTDAGIPGVVDEGGRNNVFMAFLGTLKNKGLTDAEIERDARRFNEERLRPPLTEKDVRQKLKAAFGWKTSYALNDTGNARRILDHYGEDVRWVLGHRDYIVWTVEGWSIDAEALRVTAWAKDAVARGFSEVPDKQGVDAQKQLSAHLIGSQNTRKLEAAIVNMRSEPGVALDGKLLDADAHLNGVVGGQALDLRTGHCRAVQREDYITKRLGCAFDPKATAPTWERVLKRAMRDDMNMVEYLQQVVGMSLMGNPLRLAFFINGPTGTAKSLFIETVKSLLGDYACAASRSLLMAKAHENRHGPSEELVRLAGKKLVTVGEVKEGDKIDDSVFKDLLGGGDEISARGMYKSSIEFRPNFVLMVRCNHRPRFNGDDDAVLDRIHLVPFVESIPKSERDSTLMETIRRSELSGVLNWAVQGALTLQRNKFQLTLPHAVQTATAEYGAEMNPIGRFIDEKCVLDAKGAEAAGALYSMYQWWCKEHDCDAGTATEFGTKLSQRFEKKRTNKGFVYRGIRLGGDM
jgi:putative DNA primase/helicase